MSDDRANRLRKRRRSSKARAEQTADDNSATDNPVDESGETSAEQSSTASQSTSADDSEEPLTASNEGAGADGSVKDEQVGTYMYLPESQKRELSRVFNVTKAEYEYEFDEEFEKNRHFYPLLVQYGVETLDDASAVEIRDMLESFEYR